eukprot:2712709-Rhodomonas_salina.1
MRRSGVEERPLMRTKRRAIQVRVRGGARRHSNAPSAFLLVTAPPQVSARGRSQKPAKEIRQHFVISRERGAGFCNCAGRDDNAMRA